MDTPSREVIIQILESQLSAAQAASVALGVVAAPSLAAAITQLQVDITTNVNAPPSRYVASPVLIT